MRSRMIEKSRITLVLLFFLLSVRCSGEQTVSAYVEECWKFLRATEPSCAFLNQKVSEPVRMIGAPAYCSMRLSLLEGKLAELRKFDLKKLSSVDQIDVEIMAHCLEVEIQSYKLKSYLIPIGSWWGFHLAFMSIPEQLPFYTREDYENYIRLLQGFQWSVEAHIDLMKAGILERLVLPQLALSNFDESFRVIIVDDSTLSPFYLPFRDFPKEISEEVGLRLSREGQAAISDSVIPGYRKLLKFMEEEYVPQARSSLGLIGLKNGREYYRHCIRKATTLDLTPEDVRTVGLAEVDRIQREIHAVLSQIGVKGSLPEAFELLRNDSRFYAKDPSELLDQATKILNRTETRLSSLFDTLPHVKCQIRAMPPERAHNSPDAYYMKSSNGVSPAVVSVNTFHLSSRPVYQLEALILHEGVPGHHLAAEAISPGHGAARFRESVHFPAFSEGWATYAEQLGDDLGFYQDPYQMLGRLCWELRRSCRLVLDVGVHHDGWTYQQAVDYLVANSDLQKMSIEVEIQRCMSDPADLMAYTIGQRTFLELRKTAENRLGELFDVRAFHRAVLQNGQVPLRFLSRNVDLYIEDAQNGRTRQSQDHCEVGGALSDAKAGFVTTAAAGRIGLSELACGRGLLTRSESEPVVSPAGTMTIHPGGER